MFPFPNSQNPNPGPKLLTAYFRSGWAFLIPYLAAYLLYAWLKWPVNPAETIKAIGESSGAISSQLSTLSSQPASILRPPCLLHLYWFLHGLHLILGCMALRAWWRNPTLSTLSSQLSTAATPSPLNRLWPLIPWFCLALIFWIPGTYLEWPADPWEHFRRITEWATHATAGAHSAGYKSFYFFAYSFLTNADPTEQITRLDIYSTLISLLLAWQYYRLARAVGLDSRWAFISVLANVCLFGNVCFSFYRYYTLASTMYSQLGAVALTRIVFESAKTPVSSLRSFFIFPSAGRDQTHTIYGLLFSSILLLALIASNHIQGVGIAGLGFASIAVWRTLEGKPSRIWWIIGGALTLSIATYLWWPHHPTIESVYRPGGWLNAWYGFNFAWPSPSADRAMQILGLFGLINLLAGIILLRRNHIIGWLSVVPVIALSLPFVALPFANMLAGKSVDDIITFHRMLFAIPSGLALTICCNHLMAKSAVNVNIEFNHSLVGGMTIIFMAGYISLPPDGPYNCRFWHILQSTPQDLRLWPIIMTARSTAMAKNNDKDYRLVAADVVAYALNTTAPKFFPPGDRSIAQPVAESLKRKVGIISSNQPTTATGYAYLTHDPLATDRSAWISLGGSSPEYIAGIRDFSAGSTAMQNGLGQPCDIFTADLIPIDPTKTYFLEMSLKQSTRTQAITYLAVAWYNAEGLLLNSNVPKPDGAGAPLGWINGTYSYFGLMASPAPVNWTTYRTSFGKETKAAIPSNAKYVRVGSLLNYNSVPQTATQITNIRLWLKSGMESIATGTFTNDARYIIVLPSQQSFYTPMSIAGRSSHHWPVQQLASDIAGGHELIVASLSAGGLPRAPDHLIFQIKRPSTR